MRRNLSEQELKRGLRSLSTTPPDAEFDRRLRRSLAAAGDEIRASRTSIEVKPLSRRTRSRSRTLLIAAALVVAIGLAARLYAARVGSERGAATPAGNHASPDTSR